MFVFLLVLPMSLGSDVKSLMGTGIFLTMYSQTTSMLYFSWAEMGMMGAPSATVPAGGTLKAFSLQSSSNCVYAAERCVAWEFQKGQQAATERKPSNTHTKNK